MSNLIRPSLDFVIYYLFHKEPIQGIILKNTPPRPILWNAVTSPE